MGKAVNENFCFSACSSTASTGTVNNPRNPLLSAGGSSSGCAALVSQRASFCLFVCLFVYYKLQSQRLIPALNELTVPARYTTINLIATQYTS